MNTICLAQWQCGETVVYTTSGARHQLGDRDRKRLLRDLKALGIPIRSPLTETELLEIQRMRRFLALAPGIHSRQLYAKLRTQPVLLNLAFKQYGVEP
ncbi:MAG: hypothetical protein B0A82_07605 [Alkalinema sp. CACIAM 70d]|uniref:hypothetical protein n=1 Tax=Alkalinema sp. FACHB-956 TaxID=2692768 RepID=UPI000B706D7B|nr:hypothetical protein [Alkalinema sp. FACHB-956]MBD2329664.1 hypothetical protein [Alkalinema sp. FACHB-956]OUC15337.1 MAG: hypothetical protein B0A82_07605 [Alkalinema sp. CACIAM 70d]